MSEDKLTAPRMSFVCLCLCVWERDGKRMGRAANDNLGGRVRVTDFAPTLLSLSQHASSNHFNSFTSTNLMAQSRASEVFIPNPVHNLMAFESLPLPPGWQVVHLDLIESIYILCKWKAHGGRPTWFWSATELGEPHSSEYARCQQGLRSTAEWEEREGRKRKHVLILLLALI